MNSKCTCIIFLALSTATNTSADDSMDPKQNLGADQPSLLRILSQTRIREKGHTTTFNRVAPPATTAALSSLTPSAEPVAPPLKREEVLSVGATVYDHQVTELRWTTNGQAMHAFSNIDFTVFQGVGSFETADAVYTLLFSIGNETLNGTDDPSNPQTAPPLIPSVEAFPQGHKSYLLDPALPAEAVNAANFAGMDALHLYVEAHANELQLASQQRETRRIAHELWLKRHPATSQDTTIQYWPKKSRKFLGTGGRAQK